MGARSPIDADLAPKPLLGSMSHSSLRGDPEVIRSAMSLRVGTDDEVLPREGTTMDSLTNLANIQNLGPLAGVVALVAGGCWVAWEALRRS